MEDNGENKVGAKRLFSVYGDSISTFEDHNPRYNPVYYKHEMRERTGVLRAEDTWWYKVIDHFGGELLVNDSWSGCRVTRLPYSEETFPSGCDGGRIARLGSDGIHPDVIIIHMGTNDWGYGAYEGETKLECFPAAYEEMLHAVTNTFPHAEVWCCTLCKAKASAFPDFVFGERAGDRPMIDYNTVIRTLCRKYGCKIIDLYRHGISYDSCDGIHPNASGMETLASLVIAEAEGNY